MRERGFCANANDISHSRETNGRRERSSKKANISEKTTFECSHDGDETEELEDEGRQGRSDHISHQIVTVIALGPLGSVEGPEEAHPDDTFTCFYTCPLFEWGLTHKTPNSQFHRSTNLTLNH